MKKLSLIAVVLILLSVGYCFFKFPYMIMEKTPFTNIEWKGDKIIVEINNKNYEWLSSEGESVEQIQIFAKKKYRNRWKHRIADDYILVLKEMGHWVFLSSKMKLKDNDGNIIEESFALSEENKMLTRENECKKEQIHRIHTSEIPDSLKYITQRIDPYSPIESSETLMKDKFDYNRELPMNSWMPRDLAISDLESLEYRIKNHYSYANLKNVNYPLLIDAIIADLKEGISKRDFGIQVKRLLSLFGDGHSRVPRSMLKIDSLFLPFTIKKIGGKYYGLSADRLYNANYPEIISIDGFDVDLLKDKAGEMIAKGSPQFYENGSLAYLSYYGYMKSLLGLKGSLISLQLTNGKDTIKKTTQLVGRDMFVKNYKKLKSHHKLLDNNIAYIYLHKMDKKEEYQEWLHKAMAEFKDTKALIIDIRGNGGGNRKPIYSLLPYFISSPKVINVNAFRINEDIDPDINEPIGGLERRMAYPEKSVHWTADEREVITDFKQNFEAEWKFDKKKFSKWHYSVVSPNNKHYSKPVMLLMDTNNFSASDIFLAAFKGSENIKLVGSKSGGGSGFTQLNLLPNAGLMYLLSRMASFQPNGKLYDGNGIIPDVEVELTIDDVSKQKDIVLNKAIELILE